MPKYLAPIVFIIVTLFSHNQVNARTLDIIYAGLNDGTVHLCKPIPLTQAALDAGEKQCEQQNSLGYSITAMTYGNNVLYVGTDEGKLWTCKPTEKNQCQYLNKFGSAVTSLAYYDNRLFAGTRGGTMLSCDPVLSDRCFDLNNLGSSVNALKIEAGIIYAGMSNGKLVKCQPETSHTCVDFAKTGTGAVTAIERVGNYIYATNNEITRCHYLDTSKCTTFFKPGVVNNGNSYNFSGIRGIQGKVIASFSHLVSKPECYESCFIYRYWEQSQLVSCPADNNPLTACKKVLTAKGWQRTFELGRANGPNLYYSIGKKVWFLPFSSVTATKEGWFNSDVTKLLYVER